ncbi:hypothetical protein ACF07V_36255 [Streptomyces sp. NPDC015661]|uniref:hypothetical protein n=1 Tax=Streptomyces sp. NPDC015661 TaxID=3364961 RepID=UPI0036F9E9D2
MGREPVEHLLGVVREVVVSVETAGGALDPVQLLAGGGEVVVDALDVFGAGAGVVVDLGDERGCGDVLRVGEGGELVEVEAGEVLQFGLQEADAAGDLCEGRLGEGAQGDGLDGDEGGEVLELLRVLGQGDDGGVRAEAAGEERDAGVAGAQAFTP